MMARAEAAKTTIAVVLFHNETGQPEYDRLAQQLTDATVVALAADSKYAVIGNAPVLRTPRIFEDLKKVGDELQAEYVLIAQLQNPADGLTVRLHFIRTLDLKHLWARSTAVPLDRLESDVVDTARGFLGVTGLRLLGVEVGVCPRADDSTCATGLAWPGK